MTSLTDQLTQARAEEAVRRAVATHSDFRLRETALAMADLIATNWTPKPEVDWATREAREWYAEMYFDQKILQGTFDGGRAFQALRARILALGEPVTADQVKDGEEVLVTYRATPTSNGFNFRCVEHGGGHGAAGRGE